MSEAGEVRRLVVSGSLSVRQISQFYVFSDKK